MAPTRSVAFSLPTLILASSAAVAQCATQWSPGSALGINGNVLASTTWDPDGAGPASPRLVFGGSFTLAGTAIVNNIVAWDPVSDEWSSIGSGTSTAVTALAARPDGELVAVVSSNPGSGLANGLVRWNGATWSPIATGTAAMFPASLAFLANGDLVLGGYFASIAGVPASNIARWNGVTWSAFGAGIDNQVSTLLVLANGDLVAGGSFATAGGVPANDVARWDGSSWSGLGTGLSPGISGAVSSLAQAPNGDLLAAGSFTIAGGAPANRVARWDGSSWSAFGVGPAASIGRLLALPNGHVLATSGDVYNAARISRWDGTSWADVAAGDGAFSSLALLPNGDVVASGGFVHLNAVIANRVARWDGTTWFTLSNGWDNVVSASAVLPSGEVIVGGRFMTRTGSRIYGLARRDGSDWLPVQGQGAYPGVGGTVNALRTMANGSLLVGGAFMPFMPQSTSNIAIWDGASWSRLGDGVGGGSSGPVLAVAEMNNGDIVAAGDFTTAGGVPVSCIARWNGTSWSGLGSGLTGYLRVARALAVMTNGDLMVGGQFSHAGGTPANCVARWNGTTWSALGLGMLDPVNALLATPDGGLIAAGQFNWAGSGPANGIARWNGSAWSPLGAGLVGTGTTLGTLPNGDLVAGVHVIVNPGFTQHGLLQRWDGSTWSTLGAGLNGQVSTLVSLQDGTLGAGGTFTIVDGNPSPYWAELASTCPATSTNFGDGCVGSGGDNVLTAATLPWIGSTFRAIGTGLPTVSIVLTLTSVTPLAQGALPLTAVFAQAGIGCDVLTLPDLLGVLITTNGTTQSELFLPNSSPLIGIPFFHQMVPIEVDANGAWPSVVATNALQLVAGSF